jgi:hypothetical protein
LPPSWLLPSQRLQASEAMEGLVVASLEKLHEFVTEQVLEQKEA